MSLLLFPFIGFGLLGLVLSITVHAIAILGLPQPLGSATWLLHVGVMIAMLPAMVATYPLVWNFKQRDSWRAMLRGCPRWMRLLVLACCGHAILSYAGFVFSIPFLRPNLQVALGAFSGFWTAGYSLSAAVLYSAWSVRRYDPAPRCPNGHVVDGSTAFCEECGARVNDAAITWEETASR